MSPSGIAMLVAILGTSFAGSAHCGAMCGGFVAFAAGAGFRQIPYHLGRLTTYALLGAVAGWVGSGLEDAGQALGLGQIAPVLAGLLMVAFGLSSLLKTFGIGGPGLHLRLPAARFISRAAAQLEEAPRWVRAYALGLSTTLIPCGWLYAFVIAAGGTQSPLLGAALMAVFWMGTVPILAGMGLLLQKVWKPLEAYRPRISAIALVIVGLLSIAGRLPAPDSKAEHLCHGSPSSDS